MAFGIEPGTGRTRCRLCFRPIFKGQPNIYYRGYNASGHVHILREQCPQIDYMLKEIMEEEE